MDIPQLIAAVERELAGPLPGPPAQMRMIPVPRIGHLDFAEAESTCSRAGVLVLLYAVNGRLHLLLTRRTDAVLHHKGQISFPGGRREPGEDLLETAMRETREELGVHPNGLHVLGRLTPLYIPPSRYCIHPVVAWTEFRPAFRIQPDEVAEVIEVPIDHLLDPGSIRRESWIRRGRAVEVPFFLFGTHKVWGATAMVLSEFLEIFRTAEIYTASR